MIISLLRPEQKNYIIIVLNYHFSLVSSDLSKNQISDIAADAFNGLRSLTSL